MKLPRITARKLIKAIEKKGFRLIRQSGSHKIYKNKEGGRVTIPFHAGKSLHPKIIKNVLKDADIRVQDL